MIALFYFAFLFLFLVSSYAQNYGYIVVNNSTPSVVASQPEPVPYMIGSLTVYTVKKGDTLFKIAKKYNLSVESIRAINKLNKKYILKENDKLLLPTIKIPPVHSFYGIVINIPELCLYLYDNQQIKIYPCSVGSSNTPTPIGYFTATSKVIDPIWYPPAWAGINHPVLPGKNNPLGKVWISIGNIPYGIHGTNIPSSIGRSVTRGCIRLYEEDALEVYEKVYIGMPILIIYKPIKIGYSPIKKEIYLEVHPDIYNKGIDYYKETIDELLKKNLIEYVDVNMIKKAIKEKSRLPTYIGKINNE